MDRTDDDWRARLTPEESPSCARRRPSAPGPARCSTRTAPGLYTCTGCGAELFRSGTKFDSGCGWPSFYDCVEPSAVTLRRDTSLGDDRTEVRCATCDSHLGHVFPDGFGTPTGNRYCMNSVALRFTPD